MKRIFPFVMLILAAVLVLSGCRGGKTAREDPADSGRLTGVYRGTVYPLPEGYSAVTKGASCDPETGVLRCIASYLTETTAPDGTVSSRYEYAVIEATTDAVLSERPLPLGDGMRPTAALFSGGILRYVEADDDRANLRRMDLLTGETDAGIPLRQLFLESTDLYFTVHSLVEDADGNLCLYSYPEILILSPDGRRLCSIREDSINSLAADGQGHVWAWGYLDGSLGMAQIDLEAGKLGTTVPLPAGTKQILFAPGHDLYLADDNGIAAYDYDEDGNLPEAGTPVVSFLNSDFDAAAGEIPAMLSPDAFLAAERDGRDWSLFLYRHTGDIDPDSVVILRAALSANGFVTDQIRHKTVLFNRTHDGVRIELSDYTPDSDVGPDGLYDNEKRLALAITAGTYRPDLVICMTDGPVFEIGAEQGRFRDLTPFTGREGLLNRDNLLGCVKRTFTDADGRLFALTDRFSVHAALLSTPAILGGYADRDGWTLEEFLDFAAGLPDGTILMEYLTRETAQGILFGEEGCAAFIEGNTAHFDDGLFTRCLEWLRELPTTEEYRAHAPFDLVRLDRADLFPYYRDGRIALSSVRITSLSRFISLEAVFGTKDWVLMGKPAAQGRNLPISPRAVFALTAEDERAEAAWEALAALMEPLPNDRLEDNSIPAFVSELNEDLRERQQLFYYVKYSGGMSSAANREWLPDSRGRELGFETTFTEEDAARVLDLLENAAGVPYSRTVNAEIKAIVNEEVSAFFGGVGGAEDCAKKIQSRVSLWLAEHQ